jgi:hypothetical protein
VNTARPCLGDATFAHERDGDNRGNSFVEDGGSDGCSDRKLALGSAERCTSMLLALAGKRQSRRCPQIHDNL